MKEAEAKYNLPEFIQKKHDWVKVQRTLDKEQSTFKEIPTVYPRIYQLEPTNNCNLACVMCPRSEITRPIGNMPMELFNRIVTQELDRPQAIELFGFGESLLHPNIAEMIRTLKDNGHYVVLATNGTVLTEEMSEKIVRAGLDFCVLDVDGDNKEVYEKVRRKGNYEQVEKNVKRFLKVKGSCFAVVQTILMQETSQTNMNNYRKEWLEAGADEIRVKFLDTFAGSVMVEEEKVAKQERKNFLNLKDNKERLPCPELFHGVDVWQDGTVVPCGRYWDASYPLGKIGEKSLKEIWEDEPARKLRELQLSRDWKGLVEIGAKRCAVCEECDLTNLRFLDDITNNMFRGQYL